MELTNSDKHNIIEAFKEDNPDKFLAIWEKAPKDMLIPQSFDYYSKRADLSKYIEEYSKLADNKEKSRFWLRYKKQS